MAVSSDNKVIAKTLATAFGVKPTVAKYWDDAHEASIDLLKCANPVEVDAVSYGTIGLSDHPLLQDGQEFPVRIELVGAAYARFADFPNILSSAALYIQRTGWFCAPGAVLRNAVEAYAPDGPLKHLLFTAPMLWQDNLVTLSFETKKVAWLMAVPISEAEKAYKDQHGADALEDLFEEHQIDVLSLTRASVV
ncbi:MAG: suppressor of fused domain protein [Hymenobacter sp.]|nr:MAG: suppressor of fused domain protein [Hymenobacter sp.]